MSRIAEAVERLNPNQRKAVESRSIKNLVIAGPGSGKTSVVSARTVYLIEKMKIRPENILVLTFSKAAAKEMEQRTKNLGGSGIDRVSFSTIHAFAYRVLSEFTRFGRGDLLGEKESLELYTKALASVSGETSRDKEAVLHLMSEVGYIKNTFRKSDRFESVILTKEKFHKTFQLYEKRKEELNRLDFDDLLLECDRLLGRAEDVLNTIKDRYQEIIVDEFQDINPVQFSIIRRLADEKGLMVVGDEDQSIYGFRGSLPEIMMDYRKIYKDASEFFLESNYRVPEAIMLPAIQLISNNKKRFEKKIIPEKPGGKKPYTVLSSDFQQESKKIVDTVKKLQSEGQLLSEMAVLYRNNSQAAFIAEALANENIPYQAPDGVYTVYDHWIWKDIYAYMKIASGLGSERDLAAIINKPLRYISRNSIEKAGRAGGDFFTNLMNDTGLNHSQLKKMEKLAVDIGKLAKIKNPKDQLGYIVTEIGYEGYLKDFSNDTGMQFEHLKEILEGIWEAAGEYPIVTSFLEHADEMKEKLTRRNYETDRVHLMTIHRSKGLEFGTVFIAGAVEGVTPALPRESGRGIDIDEERRLFYVAMTRAKDRLFFSVPKNRYGKSVVPSRFLAEMDGHQVSGCEVKPGMTIFHKIFGEGRVLEAVQSTDTVLLTIDFGGVLRKLDLNVCLNKGFMTILNPVRN